MISRRLEAGALICPDPAPHPPHYACEGRKVARVEIPPGARIGRSKIGKARNKFGARRTPCRAGHVHASAGEAGRCDELHLLLRAGKICALEQQPRFPLIVHDRHREPHDLGTYTADFRYRERPFGMPGATVVEDFKGADAPVNRLRRKLAEALHGIQVRVIRSTTRR